MGLQPPNIEATKRSRTALPPAQSLPARLHPLRQTRRDLPSIHHPRPHPRHTQKREHALANPTSIDSGRPVLKLCDASCQCSLRDGSVRRDIETATVGAQYCLATCRLLAGEARHTVPLWSIAVSRWSPANSSEVPWVFDPSKLNAIDLGPSENDPPAGHLTWSVFTEKKSN